jgi:hypothetical protein
MTRDEARVVLADCIEKIHELEEFDSACLFIRYPSTEKEDEERFGEIMGELAPLFEKGVEACRIILAEEGDRGAELEVVPDVCSRSERVGREVVSSDGPAPE